MKWLWIILIGILAISVSFAFVYFMPEVKMEMQSLEPQISDTLELEQVSFNPEDTRAIGYEYLNDSGDIVPAGQSTYLHIWNNKENYYFNKTSGIQMSNHFGEFWTRNIFCVGYKNSTGSWLYDCNDKLPFTWNVKSDNETYVNITGWRDKTIGNKEVRLGIRYHLVPNNKNLSVQLSVENIGDENINNDLGFAWRTTDIQIGGEKENDWIFVDGNYYKLDEPLNLSYKNLSESKYVMYDEATGKYLWLAWNENLNYRLTIQNTSKYNTPTTLSINAGTLNVGQQKTTTFQWYDSSYEILWVDSFTGDLIQWTTEQGVSPYLNDSDSNWIHEDKTSSMEEGYFGFENTSTDGTGSVGTSNIYFECQSDDGNDGFVIYMDNGDGEGYTALGGALYCTDVGSYGWETYSITGKVYPSFDYVDALSMYLDTANTGAGDDRYVKRSYINISWTFNPRPQITLTTPIDRTHFNVSSVTFNATINEQVDFCLLSISGDDNVTMDKAISNTSVGHTNSSIADGYYDWIVYCEDLLGAPNVSEIRYFTLDANYPDINFTFPTPADSSSQVGDSIYLNITANDSFSNITTFIEDKSLVGWWRMDEINGSGDPTDRSWLSNNGSKKSNVVQKPFGRFGKGFEFDGGVSDEDRIEAPYVHAYNFSEGTVSVWVYAKDTFNYRTIVTFGQASEAFPWDTSWSIGSLSANTITFHIEHTDTTGNIAHNANEWTHFVGVINSTSIALYKNGVLAGSSVRTINVTALTSDILMIGCKSTFGATIDSWNGTIDDVMIWNRSLSNNEISALYANSSITYLERNYTDLADGTYTYTAYTQDYGGNLNSTSRTITVDSSLDLIYPEVTLNNPPDDDYIEATNITLNCTSTDNSDLKNVTLYFNSTEGGALQNIELVQNRTNYTDYTPEPDYNLTLVLPDPPTSGNLLVTGISIDKDSGTISVPTGFTLIQNGSSNTTGTGVSGALAYKISDGSEQTIYWNWTTNNDATGWIGEWSGVDTSNPLDVSTENESYLELTTTSINTTTVTTTESNELVIAFVATDSGNTALPPWSWTDGFSHWINHTQTSGSPLILVANRTLSSAGTISTVSSWTGTGDEAYAIIATFKPAGGTVGWHANQTIDISGVSNTTSFYVNLTNGHNYTWNCLVCDAYNNCNWSDTNYSFIINVTEVPPEDTCTPPVTGNWLIDCTDNCDWNTPQTIPANVTMSGSGTNTLSSIFNFTSTNQFMFFNDGCEFKMSSGGEIT